MSSDYRLKINFLKVEEIPNFYVFRKNYEQRESKTDSILGVYNLRKIQNDVYTRFLVNCKEIDGFEKYEAKGDENVDLTKQILFYALLDKIKKEYKDNYSSNDKEFVKEVSIILSKHDEGNKEIVIQPYYLKKEKKFGFIINYHFNKKKDVPFNRKVQQHSLEL